MSAGESIGRDALIASLVAEEPADRACRDALANGAPFQVWPVGAPVAQLLRSYERRVRHVASEGIVTLGAGTVLDRLRLTDGKAARVGVVHSENLNFTLFLDCDELKVRSCLGVAASAASQDYDWNSLSS